MADYKMRRESLISPWGVGAIVPFPHDESLMVAGIDYWFDDKHSFEDFEIIDERLTKRLSGKRFVFPPDYRNDKHDVNAEMRIPAIRFPLWYYCPVCGNMEKLGDASAPRYCSGEKRKGKETYCSRRVAKREKTPQMIPERFVAVCEKGHIEDFPIMEWVHQKSGKPILDSCRLYRSTGGNTSSLAGIKYRCTCEAFATMSGAFSKGALDAIGYRCSGNRPWLGMEKKEECGGSLVVLQRGASNVWYPLVLSSIYIPQSRKILNQITLDVISKGAAKFDSHRVDGTVDSATIRAYCQKMHDDFDDTIDVDAAAQGIEDALSEGSERKELTEDEYRKQEFDILIKATGSPSDELYSKSVPLSKYTGLDYLKGIVQVHKLRETRVFVSFSRLVSDVNKKAEISLKDTEWLPAIKNSGEGIMLEFDADKLTSWASRDDVKARTALIDRNLKKSKRQIDGQINPIYVLLHTFAHCLINALANESGYSNSSIREKIYCSRYLDNNQKMAGILIYTASGDSEGSLGGLVRQGTPGKLESIIKRALLEASWCAADPVCIQSEGQGQDGCNLAACHNCALLPETSCENSNRFLDRGLLIGTLDNPNLGFFKSFRDLKNKKKDDESLDSIESEELAKHYFRLDDWDDNANDDKREDGKELIIHYKQSTSGGFLYLNAPTSYFEADRITGKLEWYKVFPVDGRKTIHEIVVNNTEKEYLFKYLERLKWKEQYGGYCNDGLRWSVEITYSDSSQLKTDGGWDRPEATLPLEDYLYELMLRYGIGNRNEASLFGAWEKSYRNRGGQFSMCQSYCERGEVVVAAVRFGPELKLVNCSCDFSKYERIELGNTVTIQFDNNETQEGIVEELFKTKQNPAYVTLPHVISVQKQ